MSKVLEFRGNKYSFLELIKYASDKKLTEYFYGDVINTSTGEVFDISELRMQFDSLNEKLLENLEHMSPYQRKKILEYATKGYDTLREKFLEEKFEACTITYDECKELLLIKNYKNKDILKVKFDEFYLVNKVKNKPKQLSCDYYGKFHMLIAYFMSCRNRMEHVTNGKPISKKDLMAALEMKTERAFEIFVKKLCECKLLAKGSIGKRKYLVVNPAYANMQFQITYEVYMLFKEDLDEILSPIEVRMLELSVIDSNSPFIPYE